MDVAETEAIVLHCRDYGESDRLIAFFSERGGNLRGIAKGPGGAASDLFILLNLAVWCT